MRPILIAVMAMLVPLSAAALPDNLPTNTPLRVIFVTSDTIDGNIGGLAGADSFVSTSANNPGSLVSGVPVTAILSVVGTNALDRFVDGGEPVFNTRGELVANSLSDMFAGGSTSLVNDILYDEAGNANAGIVWTGTDADNTLAPTHCTSYSTNDIQQAGRIGRSDEVDGQWTEWGTLNCVNPARLYGVTDVVAMGTAVPALGPAALGLLVLLLIGVSALVLRRRSNQARVRAKRP